MPVRPYNRTFWEAEEAQFLRLTVAQTSCDRAVKDDLEASAELHGRNGDRSAPHNWFINSIGD